MASILNLLLLVSNMITIEPKILSLHSIQPEILDLQVQNIKANLEYMRLFRNTSLIFIQTVSHKSNLAFASISSFVQCWKNVNANIAG